MSVELNEQDAGWQRERDFSMLSRRVLRYANRGVPRIDFLRKISSLLLEFSGCDAIELHLRDGGVHYKWDAMRGDERNFRFQVITQGAHSAPIGPSEMGAHDLINRLKNREYDSALPFFTAAGSFWTGDASQQLDIPPSAGKPAITLRIGGPYPSVVLIPFLVDDETTGILGLKSQKRDFMDRDAVEFYEGLAQTLGLAVADRRAQAALRERIKELTCLYGIALLTARPGITLDDFLLGVVKLLPAAWQFPDVACAQIVLDGKGFTTQRFETAIHAQKVDVVVKNESRGFVEIRYVAEKPEFAEGPFLREEQHLIDAVVRQVALVVEQHQAQQERTRLQAQLRHADRLATIGQLSAGVAHELNEPLGNILGFAQLAQKTQDLPDQTRQDIGKIITASMHAREVIRKLMLFARQTPPNKSQVDLNQIVQDGLFFLESRCAKGGVGLVRQLAPQLPEITADPAQIHQVLVNLVVNAIQAMPDGGTLSVTTTATDGHVTLSVEDTGIGMPDEVLKKVFLPFFTTKDVDQGTGLGLSVVHGIVSAHGGTISVESTLGKGSRFIVRLPVSEDTEGNS